MDECECAEGYYGFNATCLFCPSVCGCQGKIIYGCYLPPSLSIFTLHSSIPTPCPQYHFYYYCYCFSFINNRVSMTGENACNPQQTNWTG